MIMSKLLSKKVITTLAYTLLGSELVKEQITPENARRAAMAIGKAATTAGRVMKSKSKELSTAVKARKDELKQARTDDDSII